MVVRASAHAKYELEYRFIWCPKYRRLALSGNIGRYVARVIYEVAERYDFTVLELAVMPDHVHLFVSSVPDMAPARLMARLSDLALVVTLQS